jgi:hypothetical protein
MLVLAHVPRQARFARRSLGLPGSRAGCRGLLAGRIESWPGVVAVQARQMSMPRGG